MRGDTACAETKHEAQWTDLTAEVGIGWHRSLVAATVQAPEGGRARSEIKQRLAHLGRSSNRTKSVRNSLAPKQDFVVVDIMAKTGFRGEFIGQALKKIGVRCPQRGPPDRLR